MIKVGKNEIEAIPGTFSDKEFFPLCEKYATASFNKNGGLPPFSMFWVKGKMLIASWNFDDVNAKDLAMSQAKFMCRKLGVTKYFFASEIWAKALTVEKNNPDMDSILTQMNKNGLEDDPDKTEQLMLTMETKGEPAVNIHYDIVRVNGTPQLENRRIMDFTKRTGRAVGILE